MLIPKLGSSGLLGFLDPSDVLFAHTHKFRGEYRGFYCVFVASRPRHRILVRSGFATHPLDGFGHEAKHVPLLSLPL